MTFIKFSPSNLSGQWTILSVESMLDVTMDVLGPRLREQFPMVLSETYPIVLSSYMTYAGH